jgi:hypothetical protein
MESKNTKYLVLTIVLLILSGFGIFLIFKINNPSVSTQIKPEIRDLTSEISITPTTKPIVTVTPIATITGKIASPTPTKKITKITPTPTATPTAKLIITPTPTATSSASSPTLVTFKNTEDGFSINYLSSRKLYQDKESSGNRYTFYSSSGNFAVHVAPSGSWAWINSDRNFSQSFIVSGQNTYRYDIATQTIVDLQSSDKNYTIQCVHNGKESLKAECETFIKSFQLL